MKKNTRKKTPREDYELGYSNFTQPLTLLLPYPQGFNFFAIVPNEIRDKRHNVVGKANLWVIVSKKSQQAGGTIFPELTQSSTWPPSVVHTSLRRAPSLVRLTYIIHRTGFLNIYL